MKVHLRLSGEDRDALMRTRDNAERNISQLEVITES